jgi:uncharacterized membrane protein (DUF485 family)
MKSTVDRTGLVLFLIYLVIYGGFVGLTAWNPQALDATPWPGINVAILYGFGLIIAAFVLALIYGTCTIPPDQEQGSRPDAKNSAENGAEGQS